MIPFPRLPGCSLLVLLLACAAAAPAHAQGERLLLSAQPQLTVVFGATPDAKVADTGQQQYGRRDFAAAFAVPLTKPLDPTTRAFRRFRLVLHGGVGVAPSTLPLARPDRTLYSLRGGVTGVHTLNADNQLIWSGDVGLAEDDTTISNPRPRAIGSVIVAHRSSPSLTWLFGGAYSFLLGRGRPLPIFGLTWRATPETTLTVIGPVDASIRRRINSRLTLGARAGLAGNQFRIANDSQFAGQPDQVYMRLRELRLGGEVAIRVGGRFDLFGTGGIATFRRIGFAAATDSSFLGGRDRPADFLSLGAGSAAYATVGLRLALPAWPE